MVVSRYKLLTIESSAKEELPSGMAYDGSGDWLARSTALTGAADGKTFTFSYWGYLEESSGWAMGLGDGTNNKALLSRGGSKGEDIYFFLKNSSNANVLSALVQDVATLRNWIHVLGSFDLADTSNRYIFINDVDVTSSTTWTTYTNENADMTYGTVNDVIASTTNSTAVNAVEIALAHVYMDYTYRDLSNVSNRRLFITEDLKPAADQDTLSPIIYVPQLDRASAGTNEGTGGNFSVTGNPQQAQRGPNQDNCSAVEFDGSSDYMTRAMSTISSKTFTCSFIYRANTNAGTLYICNVEEDISNYGRVQTSGTSLYVIFREAGTNVYVAQISNFIVADKHHHIAISFDLTDTGKRHFYVDGVEQNPTYSTYTDTTVGLTTPTMYFARNASASYFDGSLGEFYFDTAYHDLSTNNIFWDSTNSRPKSLRKMLADTGETPLVALQLDTLRPENNQGTEGDFTVFGGYYVGARGGSEYWAEAIDWDGSTDYLERTSALTGASDGKACTLVFAYKPTDIAGSEVMFQIGDSSNNIGFRVRSNVGAIEVLGYNSAGSKICDSGAGPTSALAAGVWKVIMVSINLASAGSARVYSNHSDVAGPFTTYTDDSMSLSDTNINICSSGSASAKADGDAGFFYFTDNYYDFDDADVRNYFIDRWAYPRDLQLAIDNGDIANPLVWQKFEDSSNFGTNSGTGGDFTVNGTPVYGADVKGDK